jgi:hypothetical protein
MRLFECGLKFGGPGWVAKSRVFEVKPDLANSPNAPKVYHRNPRPENDAQALPPTDSRIRSADLVQIEGFRGLIVTINEAADGSPTPVCCGGRHAESVSGSIRRTNAPPDSAGEPKS